MSSGFVGDYPSAIAGGIADAVQKMALLFLVPVFGNFIGMNCAQAPRVIADLQAGGLGGLSMTSFLGSGETFATMPFYWIAMVFLSFTHLPTLLYPLVLLYAWLKLWLAEDEWWRWGAFILAVQPLDTWYVMCAEDHAMSRGDFALSAVVLGIYEASLIGAAIWYARQRESFE